MLGNQLIAFLPQAVILAALVGLGLQAPDDAAIGRWAATYGVSSDDSNREPIKRYLTRTKRLRLAFALVGLAVAVLVPTLVTDPPVWSNVWLYVVAGYLVGAIVAEVTLPQPGRRDAASAVLSPRTFTAYLPRWSLLALAILPVAVSSLVVFFATLSPPRRAGLSGVGVLAGAAVVCVFFGVIVWFAMRAVVRRPQLVATTDLAVLDDALRASSLHALAGAAVTLELILLGVVLSQVQGAIAVTDTYSRLNNLATVLGLLTVPMALASWVILGHPQRWRSRRTILTPS
jgi:hypothetical protein